MTHDFKPITTEQSIQVAILDELQKISGLLEQSSDKPAVVQNVYSNQPPEEGLPGPVITEPAPAEPEPEKAPAKKTAAKKPTRKVTGR